MNWARHYVFYRSLELEGNHWWLVRAKAKIGSKKAAQFMHFHLVVGMTYNPAKKSRDSVSLHVCKS